MSNWIISSWDNKMETVSKDTNDSGVEETEDKSLRLYKEKTYKVIEYISEIKLPNENEQIRLITKRSFNSVAFIQFICEKEIIEHLILVVYSFNHEAAKIIEELINNGKIKKATVFMSNLRNKAHRQKEQLTKDLFIRNPKIKLIFASSHAKIVAMKTNENNHYIIEGSGNLSYNSRIEQYVIDNCVKLYDFTIKWIDEIQEYLKNKKELIIYN
jgi:hypothetical protein